MSDPKIKEFGAVQPLPEPRKKAVVKAGPGQQNVPEEQESPATYETKVIVPNTISVKSDGKSSD